jgi:hypothetical protein
MTTPIVVMNLKAEKIREPHWYSWNEIHKGYRGVVIDRIIDHAVGNLVFVTQCKMFD